MLLLRLTLWIVISLVLFAALLFIPAGTLDWWRGWVYLGTLTVMGVAGSAWLYVSNKPVVEERLGGLVQRGQPLADKLLVLLMLVPLLGWLLFLPLDTFHWQLLLKPGEVISSLGLVLVCFGYLLMLKAMRDNEFGAPVIKHEREQRVVDTGSYAVVRHPMYAGFILYIVGSGLWLESYAGVLVGLLPIGLIVARIFLEESFLRRELPDYRAYVQKVRYRLIPYVW
jgi:protein-S-isoprenylcysteine O-methyltransferase Ste14